MKAKVAEMESKTQQLSSEIQQRKQAQEAATELEKEKVDLDLQLREFRRKLDKLQETKQADTARMEDLEVCLIFCCCCCSLSI